MPEWQCPSCGVAYHKYESIKEEIIIEREEREQEEQDIIHRIAEFRPFANFCIALFFGYSIYFLIAGENSMGVVWPIILGSSLLNLCRSMINTGIFFHVNNKLMPKEKHPTNFKVELVAVFFGGVWLLYVGFINFVSNGW
ncbi:hypothetical protein [Microbulbifer sp. THAF38]|uniref:hypothetical protein n=1 Tax=Microbulbifer sp. THAF38 TaxID=2587856 RepID=UPI0012698123|nr:hypothetical protein [Microbulbifer sp. THAF38]